MKKSAPDEESYERMDFVHILLGGTIAFGITVLLIDIAQNLLQQTLVEQGMAGTMFYVDNFQFARGFFILGLVYLPSGFVGGIYTGYNVTIKLKITLLIPTIISTLGFFLLATLLANYAITLQFLGLIVLQFVGTLIGLYLGGYAINWNLLHEKKETPGKLTLNVSKKSK